MKPDDYSPTNNPGPLFGQSVIQQHVAPLVEANEAISVDLHPCFDCEGRKRRLSDSVRARLMSGEGIQPEEMEYVTCPSCLGTGLSAVGRMAGEQLPVETSRLARTKDPATSHEAAAEMRGSERLDTLQQIALDLVRTFPGKTANEYARLAATREDTRTIPRRLSELRDCTPPLLRNKGTGIDPETGRRGLLWWPA